MFSTKLKHRNINKNKDKDAFDLQNIIRVGQSFYSSTLLYSLISATKSVIYLSFVIVNGNLLNCETVRPQLLQRKLNIIPLSLKQKKWQCTITNKEIKL